MQTENKKKIQNNFKKIKTNKLENDFLSFHMLGTVALVVGSCLQ